MEIFGKKANFADVFCSSLVLVYSGCLQQVGHNQWRGVRGHKTFLRPARGGLGLREKGFYPPVLLLNRDS